MIAAHPPAYHQEIAIDEQRVRPHGVGADSQLVDVTLRFAVSQMTKSFEDLLSGIEEMEVYIAPGLKKSLSKRMRVVHRGPLQPMPVDEAFLLK